MAKVRINGDTSGYIELASPAAAGSNTITLPSSNGSANQLLKNSGTAGTLAWSTLTEDASGNLNVDSGTLYVDASNNRVGVGTTSPATGVALHVDASGGGIVRVTRLSASATNYGQIEHDGTNLSISSINATIFNTNSSERARIDSSGKFLIGATSVVNDANLDINSSIVPATDTYTKLQLRTNNYGYILKGGIKQGVGAQLIFELYSASTPETAMVLDTAKRLLIGTSTTSNNIRLLVQGSPSYNGSVIQLANNGTTPANGDDLGVLQFSDANHTTSARISVQRDGGTWTSNSSMPTRLSFSNTGNGSASPVEKLRIDSGGTVLTYAPGSYGFKVSNAAAAGTSFPSIWASRNATGIDTGTDVFYVWSNGNVQNTNGSYTVISDAKLKENIVDANSQWSDLKAIKIRNWNFKEQTGHETHRQIGPIAQELEEVCPGLVFETPDRDEDGNETGEVTKGVNQSVLYMKAVKALQEAMERIEQLETLNASFEARLAALEVKP